MNTKQFLYDTLKSQLDIKDQECKQYNESTYIPALNEFKTEVNRWFVDNIKATYDSFTIDGNEIEIISNEENRYDFRIRLRYNYGYSNNKPELVIIYSGANVGLSNAFYANHLKLLSELTDKYSIIDDLFKNTWKVKNNEIDKDRDKFFESYSTLNSALRNLLHEIKDDKIENMKQIGFCINSFKKALNCTYDNELVESYKNIKLQYGRSQYDTTYVMGFKVLGKKGNKYNIEVYREGSLSRTFDVLEKKFHNFIDDVIEWENGQADKHNEHSTKRYNDRIKAA